MPEEGERQTLYRVVAHGKRLPLAVIEGPQLSLDVARATMTRSSAQNVRIQSRSVTPWVDLAGEGEDRG